MKDYHPEIATIMAMKSNFLDEQNFLILSLAYTTSGTNEKEIRFELGERGIAKLNELIDKGFILKLESGRIIGKIIDFKLPFSDVKKELNTL
jgi:hypothetical protein